MIEIFTPHDSALFKVINYDWIGNHLIVHKILIVYWLVPQAINLWFRRGVTLEY